MPRGSEQTHQNTEMCGEQDPSLRTTCYQCPHHARVGDPLLGSPAASGPEHSCPSSHSWGDPPKPKSWRYQYVPSLGNCSHVRSLKIECQMSGFIRGNLKLASLLTCAHGAGRGGAGNSFGYQRGYTAKLRVPKSPLTHWLRSIRAGTYSVPGIT